MWTLIKALLMRFAIFRLIFGGLGSLAVLIPIALFLKTIGWPLLVVLAVLAVPVLLVLAFIGLPFFLVFIFGFVLLGIVMAVLSVGLVVLKLALPILLIAIPIILVIKFMKWAFRGSRGDDTPPVEGPPPPTTV